ncbi:hypothetical protein ACMD2_26722 [Ananas comosus]|uniref:Uncharacterized protein n=1 Tax=Ananas comosus TaxID=4615 RepID=A0A199UKQ4_ANACO|nr:hypothetical protein ACMD2_26722 [Ananas comosus]
MLKARRSSPRAVGADEWSGTTAARRVRHTEPALTCRRCARKPSGCTRRPRSASALHIRRLRVAGFRIPKNTGCWSTSGPSGATPASGPTRWSSGPRGSCMAMRRRSTPLGNYFELILSGPGADLAGKLAGMVFVHYFSARCCTPRLAAAGRGGAHQHGRDVRSGTAQGRPAESDGQAAVIPTCI